MRHRVLTFPVVRRVAALFLATAAAGFTAACSGGSADEPSGGGDGRDNAFASYTACLAENGVTMTRPSTGASRRPRPSGSPAPRPSGGAGPRGGGFGGFGRPAGVDDATWQKAQEACSSLRPTGGPGIGDRPGANRRNAAYENCLRENGVTVTDGRPSGTDAAVQKARQTCAVLRPDASASPPS